MACNEARHRKATRILPVLLKTVGDPLPDVIKTHREGIFMFKQLLKRLIFGCKADSAAYIRHLRHKGMRIGEGTVIFDPRRSFLDETRPWMVEIGRNVQITRGVTILTHGYDWSVLKEKYGCVLGSCGKVTIGNNVFIGMNAILLKGAAIGDNTIIGAGSVVTGTIPANCVAAGNPARVICSLEAYLQKRRSAQETEARHLVQEYRAVYGKDPGAKELSEFFWLFSDDPDSLPPQWQKKMGLQGNEAQSRQALRKNQKKYENMEAFLQSFPR